VIGGFLALGLHGIGDGVVSMGLGAGGGSGPVVQPPTGAPFRLRSRTPSRRVLRVLTPARRVLRLARPS